MDIKEERKLVKELSWLSDEGWTPGFYMTDKGNKVELTKEPSDSLVEDDMKDFLIKDNAKNLRYYIDYKGYVRFLEEKIVGYWPHEWMTHLPKKGEKFTTSSDKWPVVICENDVKYCNSYMQAKDTKDNELLSVAIHMLTGYYKENIKSGDWSLYGCGFVKVISHGEKFCKVSTQNGDTITVSIESLKKTNEKIPEIKPYKGFYEDNHGRHWFFKSSERNASIYLGNITNDSWNQIANYNDYLTRKLSQSEIQKYLG